MQKRYESGRTLMEMLAVLAIVGVLTYGALVGINSIVSMWQISATYTELENVGAGLRDIYSFYETWPPEDELGNVRDPLDIRKDLVAANVLTKAATCCKPSGEKCALDCGDNEFKLPAGKVRIAISSDSDDIIFVLTPDSDAETVVEKLAAMQYNRLAGCVKTGSDSTLTCGIEESPE